MDGVRQWRAYSLTHGPRADGRALRDRERGLGGMDLRVEPDAIEELPDSALAHWWLGSIYERRQQSPQAAGMSEPSQAT